MQTIIIRWEKLRLLLNFILFGLVWLNNQHSSSYNQGIYDFIWKWIVYAIIANVFYNVCPLIDIYCAAWNIDIGDWRYILVTVAIFSICIPYIIEVLMFLLVSD